MKSLLKIVLAALVVHGSWRAGTVYLRYYRFKGGVETTAQYSSGKSDGELQSRVLELAGELHVPLSPDRIEIRHDDNRTLITAVYTDSVEVVPTYVYPWEFKVNADMFTILTPGDGRGQVPR